MGISWESELSIHEERSVAATFSRQFDKLNAESPDVGNLLKLLSFLDPENIPVGMIVDGAEEWSRLQDEGSRSQTAIPRISNPHDPSPSKFHTILRKVREMKRKRWHSRKEDLTENRMDDATETPLVSTGFYSLITLITSPLNFQTALQKLQSLSLIERRSDGGTSSLWMHDLIEFMMQDATRKEQTYRDWLQLSVSLVCGAFELIEDIGSPEAWEECEKFIPHLRSLDKTWDNAHGVNLKLSRANVRIALYMERRGRYHEAEALLQRTLSSCERDLGADRLATLDSMDGLARVYDSQGRYDEAVTLFQRALAGYEKHLGVNHRKTLTSVDNLARVHSSQGWYEEAEELFRRALVGREKHLRTDHPDTLTSVNNLALVHESQGRYGEAVTLYQRALAGYEKRLGVNHPATLISVGNLAQVYGSQGRYEEAEALCQRALVGKEKHLGTDHPNTLISVHDLAGLYQLQGRHEDAEALFQRALAGMEERLGPDHPDTLKSMRGLASLYEAQGRHDEAELLRARVSAGKGKRK